MLFVIEFPVVFVLEINAVLKLSPSNTASDKLPMVVVLLLTPIAIQYPNPEYTSSVLDGGGRKLLEPTVA